MPKESKYYIQLASKAEIQSRVEELSKRSDDVKSRIAPYLKPLWSPRRRLARVTHLDQFAELKQSVELHSELTHLAV